MVQPIAEPSSRGANTATDNKQGTDRLSGEPSSSSSEHVATGGVEYFRMRMEAQGFSSQVSKTLSEAWSTNTSARYNSGWHHWMSWCQDRNHNPFLPDLARIADFLVYKANQQCSYSYLNNLRSMFSAFLPRVDGATIGKHEVICKLMQAFWRNNPPQARYSSTWDIETVLNYWRNQPANHRLSLFDLSIKTVTLTAISSLGRAADIRHLSVNNYKMGDGTGSEK